MAGDRAQGIAQVAPGACPSLPCPSRAPSAEPRHRRRRERPAGDGDSSAPLLATTPSTHHEEQQALLSRAPVGSTVTPQHLPGTRAAGS